MGIPQIIMVGIYILNLGVALTRHGEQKKEKYNFFAQFLGTAIGIALLYWGGFFS